MLTTFRPLRPGTWVGEHTPREKRRSRYTFKAGWDDTVNLLDREILHLGAKAFVIEADFMESDIRRDGLPRANAKQPAFPGVRIAFESRHGPLVYQTDTCAFWQHNVRSIALGLEALRAVDRYGITHRAEQYTGFKAISGPSSSQQFFRSADDAVHWLRQEAGLVGADGLTMKALLRHVARIAHLDHGGTSEQWERYQEAARLLKKEGMVS